MVSKTVLAAAAAAGLLLLGLLIIFPPSAAAALRAAALLAAAAAGAPFAYAALPFPCTDFARRVTMENSYLVTISDCNPYPRMVKCRRRASAASAASSSPSRSAREPGPTPHALRPQASRLRTQAQEASGPTSRIDIEGGPEA
jgi:hypothetical protein